MILAGLDFDSSGLTELGYKAWGMCGVMLATMVICVVAVLFICRLLPKVIRRPVANLLSALSVFPALYMAVLYIDHGWDFIKYLPFLK